MLLSCMYFNIGPLYWRGVRKIKCITKSDHDAMNDIDSDSFDLDDFIIDLMASSGKGKQRK